MINSQRLTYFMAVARTLNFSRAAEQLNIAQSPLSHQVRKLESELGVELFRRSTHGVALTPAGTELFERGEAILQGMSLAEDALRNGSRARQATVSLGLAEFSEQSIERITQVATSLLPHTRLSISADLSTAEHLRLLRERKIDVGLLARPTTPNGMVLTTVGADEFILAVNSSHPWAARSNISLSDIGGETLVSYPADRMPLFSALVDQALREAGISPRRTFIVGGARAHLIAVSQGLGVSLLPRSLVQSLSSPQITWIPIGPTRIRFEIVAARYADNENPSIRTLIDAIQHAEVFDRWTTTAA